MELKNTALFRIVNEINTKTGITTLPEIAQVLHMPGVKTARGPHPTYILLKSA